MTVKLKINSVEDIKELRRRIQYLKFELVKFQAITVRELANQIILDTIQKKMRQANFSEKIVINTEVSNIEIKGSYAIIHFTSTYFSETGFDVALAREKGTKTHMVKPAVKQALRWVQLGIVKFSKGHKVTGMKALRIIGTTLDELTPVLQQMYDNKLQHWVAKNLEGVQIAV